MTEYTFTANYKPIEEEPIDISFNELHEESRDKGWTVNWEFNEAIDFYKYNNCTTIAECEAIDADNSYKTDLDANGAWLYHLGSLTKGEGMFQYCSALESFNGDLSSLIDGDYMFYKCIGLTSFNGDLSNLDSGDSMFCKTALQSFSSDLPKLTNGFNMFNNCSALTSFSGSLSNLTKGKNMFNSTPLQSFISDLSSLTNGSNMFGSATYNCTKLDLASVQNIAETINNLTAVGTTGTIGIGMQKSLQSDDETAPINVALAAIRVKGWTVSEIYV